MRPSERRNLILVLVVLCVAGVLLARRYKARKIASLKDVAPATIPKDAPDPRTLASAKPSGSLVSSDREGRRKEIGLRNIPLRSDGTDSVLRVKTRIKQWCGAGDLNAIALDLKNSDDKTMLMSLEPLDGSKGGFVKKLSPYDVFKPFETEFKVPKGEKPKQMGFFICKDSDGTGKCSNKPSTDVNKVFMELTKKGPRASYRAPDRVYVFQYVLFEGNGSASVFDNAEPPKTSFQKLGKYVETLGGKPGDAVDTAMDRTHSIKTLAVDSAASGIEIDLPVMDTNLCKRK